MTTKRKDPTIITEDSATKSIETHWNWKRALPAAGGPLPGAFRSQIDAPPCHYCGSIMTRNGSCYRCANCGSTSGCS